MQRTGFGHVSDSMPDIRLALGPPWLARDLRRPARLSSPQLRASRHGVGNRRFRRRPLSLLHIL
jgi:hypothetical protein